MNGIDIFQVIMSALVPLFAVIIAQQMITKREKSDRARTLFYGLVAHAHEYARTFVWCTSHSRRYEEWLRMVDDAKGHELDVNSQRRKDLSQGYENLCRESVEAGVARRSAAAALEADSMMLTMLFGTSSKKLSALIDELRKTSTIFEGGGPTPEYFAVLHPLEKEIRPKVAHLLQEVMAFWSARFGNDESFTND